MVLTLFFANSYQQDFYGFATLTLDPHELQYTLRTKLNYEWDPSDLPDFIARQAHFIGLYDGHGGSTASQFCRQEFHAIFENAHPSHIPELYEWIKEIGGYFNRRLRPRPLLPWLEDPNSKAVFDLEARATTAFFDVSCRPSEDIWYLIDYMRIGGPQLVRRKGSTDVRCDRVHRPTPNPRQTSSPILRR